MWAESTGVCRRRTADPARWTMPQPESNEQGPAGVSTGLTLSPEEKRALLLLARASVENAVLGRRAPEPGAAELTDALRRRADCFVTLYKWGELRGCIGSRTGSEELWRAVVDSARASATRDPRFMPVEPHETGDVEIQISVLTPPRRLEWRSEADLRGALQPMVHGVTIRKAHQRALYLPKVWEHFAGADDIVAVFLTHLSRKAGDPSGAMWKDPRTVYEVFETLDFGEADAGKDA